MPDSDSAHRFLTLGLVALGLALLGAGAMLYYHQCLFLPRAREMSAAKGLGGGYAFGNDFYPVWVTAREALRGRDPYSSEMTRQIQVGLFGRALNPGATSDPRDLRLFAHPAYTLLVLWPVAEMRFEVARAVMGVVLLGLMVGSTLLWMKAVSWRMRWPWVLVIVLLSACSYPALEGLYSEQLGLLVAFLLATTVVLLQRERLLFAGVLMALTFIKPQMTALVAFYVLAWSLFEARRRIRFLTGFSATIALLVGGAFCVWPHWLQSWLRVVWQYHAYSEPSILSGLLTSLFGTRLAAPASLVFTAAAIVFAFAIAWKNRAALPDSSTFLSTVSLLLAITTIAVLPGQAVYDHVILLPAILIVICYWIELRHRGRALRVLLALGALILFWPWIAAFSVSVVRPLLQSSTFNSPAVLALPIRTAASLPFAAIALLGYAMCITPPQSRPKS
jgi:hypothetical protein